MTILENVKVSDMEREEAIALLERYSNYDGMGIQNLAGCKEAMKVAVELLKEAFPELKESEDERIRKEINTLYSEIDTCISELLKARTDKDSEAEGKALFKMEGLMVATLQDLSCIEDYLEKQKEKGRNITANLLEDGITGVQRELIEFLTNNIDASWVDIIKSADAYAQRIRSMIEKQKEQKPAEHKAFEEWAEDYWSHNKVNNPYSYNKGDEIQFDHKGFVSFCEAYCYPQNLVLHDTFGYEEGRQTGRNEGVKLVLNNPEKYGLQKEQKPADLSEMMVHKEPYIAPVPTPMVADEQKPAEWSEEDEKKMIFLERLIEYNVPDGQYGWADGRKGGLVTKSEAISMLKSLRPVSKESLQSHWKPSEGQMKVLAMFSNLRCVSRQEAATLESLYNDLKKLM